MHPGKEGGHVAGDHWEYSMRRSEAALLMHLPFLSTYRGRVLKSWDLFFFSLVDNWRRKIQNGYSFKFYNSIFV